MIKRYPHGVVSYSSPEVQSVYSTHPVDRAGKKKKRIVKWLRIKKVALPLEQYITISKVGDLSRR